jgi:hypothetical protein
MLAVKRGFNIDTFWEALTSSCFSPLWSNVARMLLAYLQYERFERVFFWISIIAMAFTLYLLSPAETQS